MLTVYTRTTSKLMATVGIFFDTEVTDYSLLSPERVKIIVAQAYYAIICNALFSVSSPIPLSTYSVSLRVSVSALAVMCFKKAHSSIIRHLHFYMSGLLLTFHDS